MVYIYLEKVFVSHYDVYKYYTQNFLNYYDKMAQVRVKSAIFSVHCIFYT